jgi:competence protein ComEC
VNTDDARRCAAAPPILWVAAALILGLVAGDGWAPALAMRRVARMLLAPGVAIVIGAALLQARGIGRCAREGGSRLSWARSCALALDLWLLLLVATTGLLRGADARARWEDQDRRCRAIEGDAWVRLDIEPGSARAFRARVLAIRPLGETMPREGASSLRLLVPPRGMPVDAAGPWEGFARIEPCGPRRYPGGFDPFPYLRVRGAAGWCRPILLTPAPCRAAGERQRRDAAARVARCWLRLIRGARAGLSTRLARALTPAQGAFARSFLLGTGAVEPEDLAAKGPLQRAGVAHLLSVSGLHVAFIAGFLAALFAALPVSRRWRAAALIAALLFYASLAGWSAAVTRAAAGAALWGALTALGRRPDAVAILALVLAGTLWAEPGAWREMGLRLSYLVTLALIGAARSTMPARGRGDRRRARLVGGARVLIAAQTTAWPLLLAMQGSASPIYLASNALLVPFSGLVLTAILFALGLVCLPGIPPDLAGAPAGSLIDLFLWSAHCLARAADALPVGAEVGSLPAIVAALALALVWHVRRARGLMGPLVAVPACFALTLAGQIPARLPAALMLDVGQGESWAIFWPHETWVIDTGPMPPDAQRGGESLESALHQYGRSRIDRLFLTHDDSDHTGALAALDARGLRAGAIHPPRGWRPGAPTRAWIDRALARGARLEPLARGDTVRAQGGDLIVLHPPRAGEAATTNAGCLALRLRLRDLELVVSGDAPGEVQAGWARARLLEPAAIASAAHHGSASSTPPPFLEALTPAAVWVSAGRRNRYGHPHAETLERIRTCGAAVFRTDREGLLRVRPDRGGWRIEAYATRRRLVLACAR